MTDETNVLAFPGVSLDYDIGPDVPVRSVLDGVDEETFDDIIIIGNKKHTGAFYFATTTGDPKDILWDLEKAKFILMMSTVMDDE